MATRKDEPKKDAKPDENPGIDERLEQLRKDQERSQRDYRDDSLR